MAIVPNTLILNYKQLSDTYSPPFVLNYIEPEYRYGPEVSRVITSTNLPNWITITKQSEGQARYGLNSNVNNMPVGVHVFNLSLRMRVTYNDPSRPGSFLYSSDPLGDFQLRLEVISTLRLQVSPNPIAFHYTIEGLDPEPIPISVNSESAWTVSKTKNWVNLSATTGTGLGGFVVSVDNVGLAVGTHSDTITVTDDMFTTIIPLTLIITEADTESNYLYVQPAEMNIDYTVGGYLPIRQVEMNTSGNWTASASVPWLVVSQTSGVAGVAYLNVTLVEVEALTLSQDVYLGSIIFELGGLVKTINITLNVYELVESILNDEDLYFTDDNNKIILSSFREDTFLALEISSNFENNLSFGKFAIPFYAGRGERRIGAFPKKIIGHRPILLDIDQPKLFIPYAVALINLKIIEEDIVSDQVSQSITATNIKFIKGQTPSNGWMSDMPAVRFLTQKGIAALSFLSNGNNPTTINISGDVNAQFEFTNPSSPFYTSVLPMAQLPGLKIGHEIDITILDNALKIFIAPEGQDHCIIFWENQWGCFDSFECTGEVVTDASFDTNTFKFRKDYLSSETKALSSEESKSFKINTGWVRTHDEIIGLTKLLKALNIHVLYNGTLTKVNNTTKKLKVSETNRQEPSFDLTFDNTTSC